MVKFDLLYSVRFIREMLSGTWNENGSVFEFQLKTVIAGCYNRDFRLIRLQQCYCFRHAPAVLRERNFQCAVSEFIHESPCLVDSVAVCFPVM